MPLQSDHARLEMRTPLNDRAKQSGGTNRQPLTESHIDSVKANHLTIRI